MAMILATEYVASIKDTAGFSSSKGLKHGQHFQRALEHTTRWYITGA